MTSHDILHVIHLHQVPIFEQLQLEEALLRADQRNWCLINQGSSPAIVMGISGQIEELIHQEKWEQAPVPIIRRFSGGGTVFIDSNTYLITFICNTSFIPISPFPESIMRWTERLYKPLFISHPFHLKENDYALGDKKVGGNAQSICKNRWLHHTSFLWDYSPSNMDYLRLPKKMPGYRENRPHTDFLCRLSDYWPHSESFREKLLSELQKDFVMKEINKEEVKDLLTLSYRKTTAWIKGA
jgi:lipoate-protein ligase A